MAIVEDDDGVPVELATLVNPAYSADMVREQRPRHPRADYYPRPFVEPLPIGHPFWVELLEGDAFDYMRPTPDMFDIETVAHGLSGINRYLAQTADFYNVAHHSRLVADLVPDEHKLAALLHDLPEFVFGDWPSPLKALLRHHQIRTLDFYVGLARDAASIRFGVPLNPTHPVVHRADMMMLAAERRDLKPGVRSAQPWGPHVPTLSEVAHVPTVVPEPPAVSKARFLEMFYRLKGR